jgi:hypothetical protein
MLAGPRADTAYMSQFFETPWMSVVKDRRHPRTSAACGFASLRLATRLGVAHTAVGS